MRLGSQVRAREAALGAVVVFELVASVAHAKQWSKWAPDPLASDSAYKVLSARPLDSLSVAESSWVAVQRDWRAQRQAETPSSSIKVKHSPHPARRGDERFAALASQPYSALADTDRAWLVAENEAQRTARESQKRDSIRGVAIFGAAVLVLIAAFVTIAIIAAPHSIPT